MMNMRTTGRSSLSNVPVVERMLLFFSAALADDALEGKKKNSKEEHRSEEEVRYIQKSKISMLAKAHTKAEINF